MTEIRLLRTNIGRTLSYRYRAGQRNLENGCVENRQAHARTIQLPLNSFELFRRGIGIDIARFAIEFQVTNLSPTQPVFRVKSLEHPAQVQVDLVGNDSKIPDVVKVIREGIK